MKYIFALLVTILFASLSLVLEIDNWKFHQYIFYYTDSGVLNSQRVEVLNYVKGYNVELSFLQEKELSHVEDIKVVVSKVKSVAIDIYLLSFFFILLVWQRVGAKKILSWFPKIVYEVVGYLFIFSFLLLLVFNSLFEKLHVLFFPHGNWHFNPQTDLIIHLYPPEFFIYYMSAWFFSVIFFWFLLSLIPYGSTKQPHQDQQR